VGTFAALFGVLACTSSEKRCAAWPHLLRWLTGVSFVLLLGSARSCHAYRSRAQLVHPWHQIVRVGAACLARRSWSASWSGGALVDGPLRRRGFVAFVAARHVRAQKSGF